MRVLEAYALLDDAVNVFYVKPIERPEVYEALAVLKRYCVAKYEVEALKEHFRRQYFMSWASSPLSPLKTTGTFCDGAIL